MATYQILLANPYKLLSHWKEQCAEVKAAFLPVLPYSQKYDDIVVHSRYTRPESFSDYNLIIYFVQNTYSSLVGKTFAGEAEEYEGADGYTAGKNFDGQLRVGSEIFLDNLHTLKQRAYLAYHEAMHNILKKGGESLHQLGGLASEGINGDTPRKKSNDKKVGEKLSKTPLQWTGGWDAM